MLQSRNVLENSNQTTYIPQYVVLISTATNREGSGADFTQLMIQVGLAFFGFPFSELHPFCLSYFPMSSSSSGLSLSITPPDNIVLKCTVKKD